MALNRDEFKSIFCTSFDAGETSKKLHPSNLFKDGSFLCESMAITLQFDDEFQIEQSVSNFLTTVGFTFVNSGTKFLTFIISECVKDMDISICTTKYLNLCSEKYSISPNNIRIAIEKAIIRAANKSGENRLNKINEIFKADYITEDKINTSMFISLVAQRFMLVKKYNKTIHYMPTKQ